MEYTGVSAPLVERCEGEMQMSGASQQARQDEFSSKISLIEAMLDYAMIGGAELKLPWLVLLLRAARLELLYSTPSVPAESDPADLEAGKWKRAAEIVLPRTG
jgi:hypothetical protein